MPDRFRLLHQPISRRAVVQHGAKLAYAAPLISVSFRLTMLNAAADDTVSGGNAAEAAETAASGNTPPNASAGKNQTLTDSDNDGFELVTLDGSGSADTDGTIVSYLWTEKDQWLASDAIAAVNLPVGSHTIVLTVTDDDGATDQDTIKIRVKAGKKPASADQSQQAAQDVVAPVPSVPYALEATQKLAEVALKWQSDGQPPFRIYRAFDDGLGRALKEIERLVEQQQLSIEWTPIRDEWAQYSYRDPDVAAYTTYLYAVTAFSDTAESAKSHITRIAVEPYTPPVEEQPTDPPVVDQAPVVEEQPTDPPVEEQPTDPPVVDEAPVVEEQPTEAPVQESGSDAAPFDTTDAASS